MEFKGTFSVHVNNKYYLRTLLKTTSLSLLKLERQVNGNPKHIDKIVVLKQPFPFSTSKLPFFGIASVPNHRTNSSVVKNMFAHLICIFFLFLLKVAVAATCTDLSTCFPIRIGKLRAYVVSAGPLEAGNFFSVPDDALLRSYRLNNRQVSPITFSMNTLVVDLPTGRLLVDTGLSKLISFPGTVPGSLRRNLRKAGLWPGSIRYVALTHAHSDHCAGLRRDDGRKAFPNATVFISEAEHKFWIDPQLPYPSEIFPEESFCKLKTALCMSR